MALTWSWGPTSERAARHDPPVIGTLVGLLLSVLGVVAMLALYRTMVDVSTSSGQSAVRDSQLASALLGAQMELQAVGWRIEPGEAGDNLRLAGDGRGVVWRFRNVEGGPLLCAGLRIVADAPPGRRGRGRAGWPRWRAGCT